MHDFFLAEALRYAHLGRGQCAPNPSVGALAVQHHQIIAHGWHAGAGYAHAEKNVLDQFPANTPGVTLYVTLEPCNHWGRTPPCVDAIVQHGIERVVYAYLDPNPVVRTNKTHDFLTEKGVEVVYCPLPEIDRFYESYRHWTLTHTPWVTVKLAQSLDGKIAHAHGVRCTLSNEACATFTHQQRLHTDVILTTARTVHHDNPLLNARVAGKTVGKTVAILDRALTLAPDANVFTHAASCLIYHDKCQKAPPDDTLRTYHGVDADENGLDLEAVLLDLGARGHHDVWVEAGGTLFRALHHEKRVQRTYLYLVPRCLGESSLSAYACEDFFQQAHSVQWHPMDDNQMLQLDWAPMGMDEMGFITKV